MRDPGREGPSEDEDRSFPRAFGWSLRGAALVGGVFLLVSVLQTVMTGGGLLDHLAPTLAMTVIGATVGALAGPLVGSGLARRRRRKREEEGGSRSGTTD